MILFIQSLYWVSEAKKNASCIFELTYEVWFPLNINWLTKWNLISNIFLVECHFILFQISSSIKICDCWSNYHQLVQNISYLAINSMMLCGMENAVTELRHFCHLHKYSFNSSPFSTSKYLPGTSAAFQIS